MTAARWPWAAQLASKRATSPAIHVVSIEARKQVWSHLCATKAIEISEVHRKRPRHGKTRPVIGAGKVKPADRGGSFAQCRTYFDPIGVPPSGGGLCGRSPGPVWPQARLQSTGPRRSRFTSGRPGHGPWTGRIGSRSCHPPRPNSQLAVAASCTTRPVQAMLTHPVGCIVAFPARYTGDDQRRARRPFAAFSSLACGRLWQSVHCNPDRRHPSR